MKSYWAFLLWSWLAAAAWAQPLPNTAAFIDSRQECAALGGAWLANRDTWKAACQVPWSREECLRLGGGWTPMVGAPAGGVCIGQVSLQAAARQCADADGSWGPPGSSMPYCDMSRARAPRPVKAASDANKPCDSQIDCLYGCVYSGPPVAADVGVKGQCRPTSRVEGCYSMVEKGRVAGTICKK
jgi:hypothetical protein